MALMNLNKQKQLRYNAQNFYSNYILIEIAFPFLKYFIYEKEDKALQPPA